MRDEIRERSLTDEVIGSLETQKPNLHHRLRLENPLPVDLNTLINGLLAEIGAGGILRRSPLLGWVVV